ncbi:MAG TPA: 50S ribosomal protein L28 [Chloroflexota bacterium]
MSHRCEICQKGAVFGFNVSHSKRHTPRRWLPNVQRARVLVNGVARRMYACTRCIRTLQKRGLVA